LEPDSTKKQIHTGQRKNVCRLLKFRKGGSMKRRQKGEKNTLRKKNERVSEVISSRLPQAISLFGVQKKRRRWDRGLNQG
jgi:hypothetical protein